MLSDLNISVRAMSSANLLDSGHYSLTEAQVKKSAENGSIYKKRDKIRVRKVPPYVQLSQRPMDIIASPTLPNRTKSVYEIKAEEYDELKIDEMQAGLGEIDQTDKGKPNV